MGNSDRAGSIGRSGRARRVGSGRIEDDAVRRAVFCVAANCNRSSGSWSLTRVPEPTRLTWYLPIHRSRWQWRRFSGYAVIGLTFSSGHVLALRRFAASSVGAAYPRCGIAIRRVVGRSIRTCRQISPAHATSSGDHREFDGVDPNRLDGALPFLRNGGRSGRDRLERPPRADACDQHDEHGPRARCLPRGGAVRPCVPPLRPPHNGYWGPAG